PATSGFIAKFGVIKSAVTNESYAIAIVAMVASVIAAVLYLRIMVSMWLADPESGDAEREAVQVPWTAGVVVTGATLFTLFVGVWPNWLIELADNTVVLAR
ncbi:MAG: hypothetical protein ACKOA6_10705, partial [Actinomycetota bacterium]